MSKTKPNVPRSSTNANTGDAHQPPGLSSAAIAAATTVIGIVIIARHLADDRAGSAGAAFGAGIGFAVAGLALYALFLRRRTAAAVGGGAVLLFGLFTVVWTVLLPARETGQSLVSDLFQRVAPHTGLGFVLTGFALALSAGPPLTANRLIIAQLAGSSVAFGGAVSAVFHSIDAIPAASPQLPPMTLLASIAFAILGVGLILAPDRRAQRRDSVRARDPLTAGLLVLVVTYGLMYVLRSQQRVQIGRTVDATTSSIRDRVRDEYDRRVSAVRRMAERQRYRSDGRPSWVSDATAYIRDFPGFTALTLIDTSYVVRDVVPREGREALQGFDLSRGGLPAYRNRIAPFASGPLDFVVGGRGFLVIVPTPTDEGFGGFVMAVFDFTNFFDAVLENAARGYSIVAATGGEEMFRRGPVAPELVAVWGRELAIDIPRLDWTVRVWPERATLRLARTPVPLATLLLGHVLAGLLAVSTQLANTTARREAVIAAANRELEKEIADRRRAEAQLRQSQKMEAVGRLAGGIAHDFNNLLTVVRGYIDLLLPSLAHPDDRKSAEEIDRAATRAADLTNQLLAFSRRQVLRPKVVILNQVVTEIQDMLGRLIGEHITVVAELSPDLWAVEADPGQLQQVIVNLAINSRDAMPEGGRFTVQTRNTELTGSEAEAMALPAGEYVQIAVTDTGVGMEEETLARVFEPFFTTKERGRGTGLGLATAYGIVKQSGGGIQIDSTPETGTRVTIYLPRSAAAADTAPSPDPETVPIVGGTESVLVVEDEEAVRALAQRSLAARGYRVLVAENGAAGLEVARGFDGPIDLLVTDVIMPSMSGPRLAARLTSERPGLRVLFVSGYTDIPGSTTGERLIPRHAFLRKPFTPNDLARAVRSVLDTKGESDR